MPPLPQHCGQPHPPALPSPNPGLHLFLLGPAIQLLVHKYRYIYLYYVHKGKLSISYLMFDILGVPFAAVSVHGDFPPKIRWNFGGLDNSQLYRRFSIPSPLPLPILCTCYRYLYCRQLLVHKTTYGPMIYTALRISALSARIKNLMRGAV